MAAVPKRVVRRDDGPFMNRLAGLIAATFTPLQADGSLALERIDAYADFLLRQRLTAVFVCGTTGESLSLSTAERMQVTERWQEVLAGQLPVIVNVSHNSLADGRALAEHAQRIGAAAISAMAPCFFKPALPELVVFAGAIAAAAPRLPFYFYHIPSLTGVSWPMARFLEAAGDKIPTLAGLKFTFEDLMDLQNCLRLNSGRYQILFGRDEILLAGLALGCRGAVGSTYNFAAPLYQQVIAAFQAGDLPRAQAHQQRAVQMISLAVKYGGLPAMKALMRLHGVECGPVRLPLRALTAAEQRNLELEWRALNSVPVVAAVVAG